MQTVFEGRCHTKVATTTPHCPEQVGVVVLAGCNDSAVGEDELGREKIVEGKRMLAHEPADPTADGRAGDARRRDHTSGRGETMELGFAVEQVPGEAALCAGRARPRGRRECRSSATGRSSRPPRSSNARL